LCRGIGLSGVLIDMDRKNPTSSLRTGFDYQDTWGLYLCAQWLSSPGKFKWIRFETIPAEVTGRDFYLDDIILCGQNDLYHLYQIKHKQRPVEDLWSWETLLEKERTAAGKLRDSLLQKWNKSYSRKELKDKIEYAAFLTNGHVSTEIETCIVDGLIDINRVSADFPDIYSRIREQLGNEKELHDFFSNFKFLFGQKDNQELEAEAREILYETLKVTEKGVINLFNWIHKECGRPYTTELNLDRIREWCEFDIPRTLNESFYVPEDFELFDKSIHEKIVSDLQHKEGGIKVICGKPGSGKSTYISRLNEVLTTNGSVCIRHHYYISPDDPNPLDRLQSSRVEEAIKAQFKEHSEELEELANQNSGNVPLPKFIGKLAAYFHQRGRAFVLIIDGLDHVLRYAGEQELKRLIREICFPQPGLWIIFGTQEAAKEWLPQIVFDKCPEKDWTEVKGLSDQAVSNIIGKNLIGLNLPKDEPGISSLKNKIIELTQGNPLHLRYTLKQLKTALGNKLASSFECTNLLPYGDGISQYYDSLWRRLPIHGQTTALVISCAGFRFSEEQLLNLLSSMFYEPSKISEGYRSVAHLLSQNRKGISIFHSSFESFMVAQPEFQQQNQSIKASIKNWLENSNFDELKWAELRKLAYDLGDPEPILELGRNWLIDALCFPREPRQVTSQLELGAKAAFEKEHFGKAFELAMLNNYYRNAVEYVEEYEKVWEEAFEQSNGSLEDIIFNRMSSKQIRIFVQKAVRLGVSDVLDEAVNALNEQHVGLRIISKGEIGGQIPQMPSDLIRVIALNRQHEIQRVHSYIKQFEESGWAEDLFADYVDSLVRSSQYLKVQELLELGHTPNEKRAILDVCARHDLTHGECRFLNIIARQSHESLSHFCLLYLILKGKQVDFTPPLPQYELFPDNVPEYESGKREERAKIFSENFVLGVIYGLTGKEKEIHDWIAGAEPRWSLEVMSQIFRSALTLAEQVKESKSVSLNDIFMNLARVSPLRWPERRDLYELQICLRRSLYSILRFNYSIKRTIEPEGNLNTGEMEHMVTGPYFDRNDFLQFLLSLDAPFLSGDTYEQFITDEKTKWSKRVTHFQERAGHYADLAKLGSIHKDDANREAFLKLAAANLLGYGYHKDIYLDGVLQSIEICNMNGLTGKIDWIKRLAPIVENVTEYTDGDETGYFPKHLADVLSKVTPGLLYKYYYQKAHDEDLFLAQDIFKYVVRSLQFDKREGIALATTALDQESYNELRSLSAKHEGAAQALNNIDDYFGPIEFPEKERHDDTIHPAQQATDFSAIMPHELEKRLESFVTRWDERDFLIPWSKVWLEKEGNDKKEAYQALTKLVEKDGIPNTESELLDILYPLAYEYANNKAFEYLCWAQANDSGWELYWTDRRKAERRWDLVKKHHADRHMEFFAKSIVYSGKKFGRGGKFFVPVPRGIEFLALFGKIQEMEEITESSVKFAESMMANMELPASRWLDSPDIDELDIILQRLIWPSALVRERAATALAGLLKSAPNKEHVLERLMTWISGQELESVVAIGLLPLVKAAELTPDALTYVDTDRLMNILPVTSVVIEKVFEELTRLLGRKTDFNVGSKTLNSVQAGYTVSDFFRKYISSFLAPIYRDRGETIEKKTLRGFIRQWAFTAEEMMKATGLQESRAVLDFMKGYQSPHLIGMSTMLSELYRSAFLRVLRHFRDQGWISNRIYLEYAYATLPVELSYWKVKPSRAPGWWPKLQFGHDTSDGQSGLRGFGFERGIDQIVNCEGEVRVLGLDGIVEPAEGWVAGLLDTSVTLVGFGYKVTGPNLPEAKEVANAVLYSPLVVLDPAALSPFNFLESYYDQLSIGDSPVQVSDLMIYPLVARNRDLVIALWQWFRDYLPPFGLFGELNDDLRIELEDRRWEYVKNGHAVARSGNWLEGLKERYDKELGVPSGNYIETEASFLKSYLDKNRLRLGYVLKTTHKYRDYSYEEAKSFDTHRLIGVSPLIV